MTSLGWAIRPVRLGWSACPLLWPPRVTWGNGATKEGKLFVSGPHGVLEIGQCVCPRGSDFNLSSEIGGAGPRAQSLLLPVAFPLDSRPGRAGPQRPLSLSHLS